VGQFAKVFISEAAQLVVIHTTSTSQDDAWGFVVTVYIVNQILSLERATIGTSGY